MYADYRQKAGTAANGIVVPQNEEYDQASEAEPQYQPFVDLEIPPDRPPDHHPRVPGKWVDWRILGVDPLANQKSAHAAGRQARRSRRTSSTRRSTTKKLMNNWSVYGQYATGILVPDIGDTFEVSGPTSNPASGPRPQRPTPQTSTNYQLGTVYHGSNWTADFDLYKIDFRKTTNRHGDRADDTARRHALPAGRDLLLQRGRGDLSRVSEGEATYAFHPFDLRLHQRLAQRRQGQYDPPAGQRRAQDARPRRALQAWRMDGVDHRRSTWASSGPTPASPRTSISPALPPGRRERRIRHRSLQDLGPGARTCSSSQAVTSITPLSKANVVTSPTTNTTGRRRSALSRSHSLKASF